MRRKLMRLCALAVSAACLSAAAVVNAGAAAGGPVSQMPQPVRYIKGPVSSSMVPQTIRMDVPAPEGELRGVWVSYLIWDKLPVDERSFQQGVDEILDNCVSWGMNAVFVHVRSHGDAMYPSDIYPWSKFASGSQGAGVQGRDPGYDPLAYFVKAAHDRGLKFHAWFNPYRITGYLMNWSEVSSLSPAKLWMSDGDVSNDRNVLRHDGAYYYNPSSEEVKQMVVNGVMEVVRGYDVDGIHFDDYFYPELDDTVEGRQFDLPEYRASGSRLPVAQWRRDQVSDLVSRVYRNGNQAEIRMDGVDYAVNKRGLNIAVFEPHSGVLIDSAAFDTHVAGAPCSR